MRPLISRATSLKAAVLFSAWTAYGLLCASQSHYWYASTKTPLSWPDSLRYELSYSYAWAFCSPVVLWAADRFRLDRKQWPTTLLIHAVLMTAMIVVTKTAFDLIGYPPSSPFRAFTWQKWFRSIEMTFDTGTLLYTLLVLVHYALTYYHRYRSGVIKASQLQTQLVHAQLQALKMQLHPHFLFNTLHTITALVHEDPDRAERTIARLGELLRLFLANSTIHEVRLREELRILELYLDIERARFEERLQVRYEIPQELYEAMVPSLVLQPLVENAIRHGIGKRAAAGSIEISANRYEETLVLRVSDDGEGIGGDPMRPIHQGMGLAITRGRLESLYGAQQALVLSNSPRGGAEVRITMPFRRDETGRNENEHAELQGINR